MQNMVTRSSTQRLSMLSQNNFNMYDMYSSFKPGNNGSDGNDITNDTTGANFAFGLFDITGSPIDGIEQFVSLEVIVVVQNYLTAYQRLTVLKEMLPDETWST